jgi:F-type H+-transporting ATPase subunit gamma
MSKTRELKRRIRSIGKTRQITRTMEMVSTSKLKRATDRVYAARPYADRLREVIGRLIDPELRARYPLLRQPETVRRAAVILITSNRGLAGAFNANLIREGRQLIRRLRENGTEVEIHAVGKKGVASFASSAKSWPGAVDITDKPTVEDAISVIDPMRSDFEDGRLDEVYVVHAQFRSALSTPPGTVRVLPVALTRRTTRRPAGRRATSCRRRPTRS